MACSQSRQKGYLVSNFCCHSGVKFMHTLAAVCSPKPSSPAAPSSSPLLWHRHRLDVACTSCSAIGSTAG